MPEDRENIIELYQRFLSGECTRAETRQLLSHFKTADEQLLLTLIERELSRDEVLLRATVEEQEMLERLRYKIKAGIHEREARANRLNKIRFRRRAAAVILVFIVGGTLYYMLRKPKSNPAEYATVQRSAENILPGSNKAVLTLANGTKIRLDSAHKGRLANQGGSKVLKAGNGLLTYSRTGGAHKPVEKSAPIPFNTLTTPRGGQYQLVLPDGSKVWLNAASSIRYPAEFTGNRRIVEITGEAYFEVARDVLRPFIVKVQDEQIEVLGTHFNVMAYRNERSMETTLIEGSVRVTQSGTGHSHILRPGEQSRISYKGGSFDLIAHADVRLAIAWKNGMQAFHNADIATIMREVERWYDVDVVYQGEIPQRVFSGEIPRSASLSELLKLFEVNKIHFRIDAMKRKLTVLP